MITLLSPTRTMNMSPVLGTYPPATTPQFLSEAERIISGVKELSAKELEKQMNLSQEIAENDFHYFQQFDSPTTIQKQAVLAYSGAIYQKLDAIKAYRLMFSLKVPNLGTENLYQFWKPIITKALINDILTDGGILINLASEEIFKSIDISKVPNRLKIIQIKFKEYKNISYKSIQIYSKQSRGNIARYIVKNQINRPENIQQFNQDGYQFDKQLSTPDKYIFTR
ncbi:MAG: peroxide stress protein YaaA [Tannerella sp.]|uniref:YaaA family protein n=1 Tax=uncultured Coprobacter sp. TaxID=1720550 RepID=UPI002602ACBB|nr:YaaA family protein [uncultured Coprobacter sp.]MBS6269748.1 peroxide stress protein YaaA [Tannerella sp.]